MYDSFGSTVPGSLGTVSVNSIDTMVTERDIHAQSHLAFSNLREPGTFVASMLEVVLKKHSISSCGIFMSAKKVTD